MPRKQTKFNFYQLLYSIGFKAYLLPLVLMPENESTKSL